MSASTTPTTKLSLRQRLRQSLSSRPSSNQISPATQSPVPTQNVTFSQPVSLSTASNVAQSQQQLLSPHTSGQNLLDRALLSLSSQERTTLQEHFVTPLTDVDKAIEQGITAAKNKRQSCLDKRWTVTLAGRHVVLREEADKVVGWLDRFKGVGDVAANADPIHVGLPWAGIRLLLEGATAEKDQMAILLVGCETVLYMANRLKAYTGFMQSLPLTLTRNNLEESVVYLYAHILHFLARAIQIYQTSTIRRTMSAFGRVDDIVEFEKKGNELAMKVEFDASACGRDFEFQTLQRVLAELLQVRQLQASLDQLHLKIDLGKIPYAKGAIFNSADSIHTFCHPLTRIDLLAQIQQWAQHPTSKDIFWLHGAAGAGKSTISWTTAQWLTEQGGSGNVDLAASFFFKRGESDRGSAARFFPTIVRQLILKVSGLDILIAKVVEEDPFIFDKALGEQFRRLLQEPLQDASLSCNLGLTLVVVVDALDECENDNDVETILQLWSYLSGITKMRIRLFLTSRPDPPVRLKFKQMSTDLFDNIVLQDAVPVSTIKQDLWVYLRDAFTTIREQASVRNPLEPALSKDWPSDDIIMSLVEMAVPLFIVAATVCRFVGDLEFDPSERLDEVLTYRRTGQMAQMEMTYLPVLNYLTANGRSPAERKSLCEEFRVVIGSIICLFEPMSVTDLSTLLKKSAASVMRRLHPLHSVLQVPDNHLFPVRTLHLSFAEFLLSENLQNQPYGINGPHTHFSLAKQCLQLLSGQDGLQENMCSLDTPGWLRQDVDKTMISKRFSPAFQYACRYWVHHIQYSEQTIVDDGPVHNFLRKHYLHWLEALSLIDRLSEVIELLNTLQELLSVDTSDLLSAFLEDARRFYLAYRYIINQAPCQLYSSAIIFTPLNSLVRNICGKIPGWIQQHPTPLVTWNLELQKLEGHSGAVNAVAFSFPSGSLLASASTDWNVRVWDTKTGQEVQKLTGHSSDVTGVAFSPDGILLASASKDKTVKLWNTETGMEMQTLQGSGGPFCAVAFSPTGRLLALASEETHKTKTYNVLLWDVKTGGEVQKLRGHEGEVNDVAFSPDGSLLASGSADETVRIWDVKACEEVSNLKGNNGNVYSVAFSPTRSLLAAGTYEGVVQLWDINTGQEVQILRGHDGPISSVAFSPDGSLLASASHDSTIRLWDIGIGQVVQKLEGHSRYVLDVAFSPDGLLLASASGDSTVRLWDVRTGRGAEKVEKHRGWVHDLAFSPDRVLLASASSEDTARLWSVETGREVQSLQGHTDSLLAVKFSPDGLLLATSSWDSTIRLWNVITGHEVQQLEGHSNKVIKVDFSPDGTLLASVSDKNLWLWNVEKGAVLHKLEGHNEEIRVVAFSSNGLLLASVSEEGTVRLWEVKTGQQVQKLVGMSLWVRAVTFSPDGSLLAAAFFYGVRLWEVKTGTELQKLDNIRSIAELSITNDNKILVTERGAFNIQCRLPKVSHKPLREPGFFGAHHEWIMYGESKLLWLPHEHRGRATVRGGTIAIGGVSGRVSIFKLVDPKSIDSQ